MNNSATASSASASTPARPRRAVMVVRILLGFAFTTFGLNAFLNFIPQPETPLPEKAIAFSMALMNTGYMLQLIGITQLVSGIFLLTNRFVPLALVLLAPFLVNALAFHIFLEHSGLVMAAIFTGLELYLLLAYRACYRPMLAARTKV